MTTTETKIKKPKVAKATAVKAVKSSKASGKKEGSTDGGVVCPVVERRDRALGRVKLKLVSFDFLSKR